MSGQPAGCHARGALMRCGNDEMGKTRFPSGFCPYRFRLINFSPSSQRFNRKAPSAASRTGKAPCTGVAQDRRNHASLLLIIPCSAAGHADNDIFNRLLSASCFAVRVDFLILTSPARGASDLLSGRFPDRVMSVIFLWTAKLDQCVRVFVPRGVKHFVILHGEEKRSDGDFNRSAVLILAIT